MSRPIPFSLIAMFIVSLFLLIAAGSLVAGQTSAAPVARANQASATTDTTTAPVADTGRPLSKSDWIDHVPLWLGMILFVIVVDGIFVGKILYSWSRQRATPSTPETIRR